MLKLRVGSSSVAMTVAQQGNQYQITTTMYLPDKIECPDFWQYSDEWRRTIDWKAVNAACRHSDAERHISSYITFWGERALNAVRKQNFYIASIAAGDIEAKAVKIDINDRPWHHMEPAQFELKGLYNVDAAPEPVKAVLDAVFDFAEKGAAQCYQLEAYIAYDRQRPARAMDAMRDAAIQESTDEAAKWESIDAKHSAVREGFIYLLSNALMPGVYKIGFTAGNPDARAKKLSQQHRLPAPFKVVQYWRTKDPYLVEQRVHETLAQHQRPGEFFEVSMDVASAAIAGHLIPE